MNLRRTRNTLAALAVSGVVALGLGTAANAQTSTPPTTKANPLKCVGAAEHKQAQAFHLQGAQANLAALNARLAAAQQAGNTKAVERIQANIAKVNERIVKIQARQAQFAQRCP